MDGNIFLFNTMNELNSFEMRALNIKDKSTLADLPYLFSFFREETDIFIKKLILNQIIKITGEVNIIKYFYIKDSSISIQELEIENILKWRIK